MPSFSFRPVDRPKRVLLFFSILIALIVLWNSWLNAFHWSITDMPTHVAKLFFLDRFGYGATTQLWNFGVGYTLFSTYPPLFFSIPSILLVFTKWLGGGTNPYVLAYGLSVFPLLALLFCSIRKKLFRSNSSALIFLSMVFFNPLSLNWLFEGTRFPELSGWVLFSVFAGHLLSRPVSRFSLREIPWLGILLGLTMLAHPAAFILAFFLYAAYSISHHPALELRSAWIGALSLLVSAFWWIPYQAAKQSLALSHYTASNFLSLPLFVQAFAIASVAVMVLLAVAFWNQRLREKALFFGCWSALGIVLVSGFSTIVPVFNLVQPQSYFIAFSFLGLWGIHSIDWKKTTGSRYPALKRIGFALAVLVLLYSSVKFVQFSEKNQASLEWEREADVLAQHMRGAYACLGECGAEISYWTVNYSIPTVDNFSAEATPLSIVESREKLKSAVRGGDCDGIQRGFEELRIGTLVVNRPLCETLSSCGKQLVYSGDWCEAFS